MKAILIASIAASLASSALSAAGFGSAGLSNWDEAPEDFKKGVEAQVAAYAADPDATPETVHAAWLAQKQADGWTYGQDLDAEKKVSPTVVPWADASPQRRMLETMLHACAKLLKDAPDAAQVGKPGTDTVTGRDVAAAQASSADGVIPVQYVGHRDTYTDGLYGTRITFARGETRLVPAPAALQMLRHADVYARGQPTTVAAAPESVTAKPSEKDVEEDRLQDVRDSISAMRSKAAVAEFITTNFAGVAVDKDAMSLADLKARATQMVDQFGIAQ